MSTQRNTLRRFWLMAVACSILGLSAINATAQDNPPPHDRRPEQRPGWPPPFPPDPTFNFLSSEMRFEGKIVKGAPYSATSATESVQTLADGTKISRKSATTVYRDTEGRTRREQTINSIGPFASSGDAPKLIFINDPVAGVQYVLDPKDHTARKMRMPGGPPPPMRQPPTSSQAKTESLGTQTIEGVEAEGTRSTLTIPSGQIGNDRPIEIVTERWYSAALQVVVLSKHRDPRMGEHTYRLTGISRIEPAHSLFEIPSDYTIKEGPPRQPSWGGGRKRPGDREDR